MGLAAYLTLSAVVFCIGLFGTMTRRNTVGILLGIELMLNAVNINFVAFSRFHGTEIGMVFTLFAICITVRTFIAKPPGVAVFTSPPCCTSLLCRRTSRPMP